MRASMAVQVYYNPIPRGELWGVLALGVIGAVLLAPLPLIRVDGLLEPCGRAGSILLSQSATACQVRQVWPSGNNVGRKAITASANIK